MSLARSGLVLAALLLAAGCRGPLVGGELSNGGDGSSAGSGAGGTGEAGAGATSGGTTATGVTGTAGGDDTSGSGSGGNGDTSGSGGSTSGSGSDSGGADSNGGEGSGAGADSSGGESGLGGTASGGSGGALVSGCDTCLPEVRVAGADLTTQYAKCSAMSDGVVYQSVLDLSAGVLTPDVVVRAVTLESGAAVTLSGADEANSIGDVPVLAIDDAFVYWFSRTRGDGTVLWLRRRALDGGGDIENLVGVDTALGEPGGMPKAMAAGAGYVYWGSGHEGVFRCPTTEACDAPELVVAGSEDVTAPLPDVLGLDLDGDTLYWADTTTGEVRRRVASGTEDLLDTVEEPLIQICDVSFDSGSLFWILCVGTYEVRRVDPSGPSSALLATTVDTLDETAGGDLLVAGDDVYFISSDYLYQVPRDGSAAAQRLAMIYRPGEPGIHTVVGADAEDVFLTDEVGGILSVPR